MTLDTPGPQYQGRVDRVLATPLNTDVLEGRRVSQNPLVIERPDIHLRVDQDLRR